MGFSVMVKLDLRNVMVPFCLLKASNAFRSLKAGDILEILCSDPDNIPNLMRIIPSDSCELLSVTDLDETPAELKVRFKKINPKPLQTGGYHD